MTSVPVMGARPSGRSIVLASAILGFTLVRLIQIKRPCASQGSLYYLYQGGAVVMDTTQSPLAQFQSPSDRADPQARQIDAAGWAVFFIWVGVALLAHIPWGWFLVGVGVLVLGAQAARRQMNLKVETSGIVIGLLFLVGGVWELLALQWPLIPILLILLGVYLLQKSVRAGSPAP
jgi:hypothetical protein